MKKKHWLTLAATATAALIAGVHSLTGASGALAPAQVIPEPTLPPVTVTAAPLSTATPEPCAFVWATQPLDEASAQLNAALQAAGLSAEARAEAYGEKCINADGSVQSFSTMQTDFRIIVQVATLDDHAALGDLILQVTDAVLSLPPDVLAGPNMGYLGIEFVTPAGESERIWQPLMHIVSLRAEGLGGAELLNTLLSP